MVHYRSKTFDGLFVLMQSSRQMWMLQVFKGGFLVAMLERSVGHQASSFMIPRAQEIYFVWEYFGEPNTFWWVGQMLFCGANTFGGENTFGGANTE